MGRRAGLFLLFTVAVTSCNGCDLFTGPNIQDAGGVDGGVGHACASAMNCRATLICSAAGTCQPAGNVAMGGSCQLTGDCMSGLYCGPLRTCVTAGSEPEGGDCNTTADCTQGLYCNVEGFGGRCRAPGAGDLNDPCTQDVECLAGLRCNYPPGSTSGLCASTPPMQLADGGVVVPPPTIPYWPGVECTTDTDPTPHAYFHVPRGDASDGDFFRLPFPNDVRRTANGLDLSGFPSPGTALSFDILGRYVDAAEEDLQGFSINPTIYFRFSTDYEWNDITAERFLLIDVTPTSPDFGQNLGRAWFVTAGPITRYICPPWLAMRRGHGDPLRPGTTYAAILLRGVRTNEASGHMDFARDPDLDMMLGDTAPTGEPLASAWTKYQPLRDWLAMTGAPDAADVLSVAQFTTTDPRVRVPALRAAIRAGSVPTVSDVTVCSPTTTSPCDDGGLRRCGPDSANYWEVHARISLPQYQQGTPPFEEPTDGGAIMVDGSGTPLLARTEPVCMVMTIPKASTPAGGFPLVIYAHGTGGAFTSPIGEGLTDAFAMGDTSGAGRAVTVSIDMPLHGSRRGASTRSPDALVFNFVNPRAARDNFLQGSADLMSLVYWAQSYVLPAAMSPTAEDVRFDPTHVVLWGHSQGATHSQLILPYENGVIGALLSGAGGDLTESLLTKTQPTNIAGLVPLALLDRNGDGTLPVGDYHPALALFQMYFDPVDPVNFGRHYRYEPIGGVVHHIFMTYGLGDSYSTERTMRAFAGSAGFPVVGPAYVDLRLGTVLTPPVMANLTIGGTAYTIGLRQYMPDPGVDGHFVATMTAQGRMDTTRFVQQLLAGAVPQIGN